MSILFKGDNKALISSINALLALDAKGKLSPHGIGEMARDLLETCAARLPAEQHQIEQVAPKSCDEANQANGPTFMGEPNPHHSIDWYREGISKHWKTICDQRLTIARLTSALKFYADRDHYSTDDGLNWDSCSGEPANILWHESEPWFIEDGAIARAALEGNRDDDIPDLTPGKGNKAERRATQLLAQLQADLTARDERIDTLVDDLEQAQYDKDAWKNDKESLWVQVFHGEGDDPFISAVSGAICIEQLTLIQEEIVTGAEDLLESGPGFYVLRCRHHEAHYDNVGMTEPAHWEIDFESYSRFPWADEAEAMVKEAQPDYPECPTHAPDKPCPGCGTPGYTATCDKCIPY